jgi:hypothetical protein
VNGHPGGVSNRSSGPATEGRSVICQRLKGLYSGCSVRRGRVGLSLTDVDEIVSPDPSVGVIIGTFAALPYVHLHLESWKRNFPSVPVLVHDDCSPQREELATLCREYGAEFYCRQKRGRKTVGDMNTYPHGIEWAVEAGIEIVVKMSRRFIPVYDWVPGLKRLAWESQLATYSESCRHFDFGFRTECVGFHVPSWVESGQVKNMQRLVVENRPMFVESEVHEMARVVHQEVIRKCRRSALYSKKHPRSEFSEGYAAWDIMPPRRLDRSARILWHDSHLAWDYARQADAYGLPYKESDFSDPNQGFGAV